MNVDQRIGSLGDLIRAWRTAKGFSQLDLALESGVSSRHISFLETGRAKPSRETLMSLSDALGIEPKQVNVLMAMAGYTAPYLESDLNAPEMRQVKGRLDQILEKLLPLPAYVYGATGNLLMANKAMGAFLALVEVEHGELHRENILFHPRGLRCCITNWEETAALFLRRMHRTILQGRSELQTRFDEILAYPGVEKDWLMVPPDTSPAVSFDPIAEISVKLRNHHLNFVTMLTTFGSAVDMTLQEITIEYLFNADEATLEFCQGLCA